MTHNVSAKISVLLGLLLVAPWGVGASFSSQDKAFTMDMPAGWKQVANPQPNSVLALEKGNSRIDIKTIECPTETCLENKINNDLTEIKRKKMQVIGNSYTGEDIKRIEFSTGEPFFYISFFTSKNDFGAGYFLINSQAYSILARNLTYAETDLIFSFISPITTQEEMAAPVLEANLNDPRVYSVAALPQVDEEILLPAEPPQPVAQPEPAAPQAQPLAQPAPGKQRLARYWNAFKKRAARLRVNTFVSPQMPPYIRQLGHLFDMLILLGILYGCVMAGALLVRYWVRCTPQLRPANPNSHYPVRFVRLYGTPSLIFRAKDNQGNTLISLSSRWDSLFIFSGILCVILTGVLLALTGVTEQTHWLSLSAFTYNTIYSVCSLLIPLGLILFFCGVVWSQLLLREINLFDHTGKKAAIILQKGFGLNEEKYEIYFARSREVLTATRKRFAWRRTWALFNHEHQLLAHIREVSPGRAFWRKLCGHLWGFLRADYEISGRLDSTGSITNAHRAFNRFTCQLDKPQAINARDLLAVSFLINIRDRDKWYPWFN